MRRGGRTLPLPRFQNIQAESLADVFEGFHLVGAVEPHPEPGSQADPLAAPPTAVAIHCNHGFHRGPLLHAAPGGDPRYYAVWKLPGCAVSGIFAGPAAWARIVHLGGEYGYARGHRLRRFPSQAAATDAYYAEARHHNNPLPVPLFQH